MNINDFMARFKPGWSLKGKEPQLDPATERHLAQFPESRRPALRAHAQMIQRHQEAARAMRMSAEMRRQAETGGGNGAG